MTREVLIGVLAAIAGAWFIAGVVEACYFTTKKLPDHMPQFLADVVASIGGVFAANLGALVGFTFTQAASLSKVRLASPATWLGRSSALPGTTQIQLVAAIGYLICLSAATVVWGMAQFSQDPKLVVPTLPQLAKTLLGVVVGGLGVLLGTTT